MSNKQIRNDAIDKMLDIVDSMSEEDVKQMADSFPPPSKLCLSEGEGVIEKRKAEPIRRCGPLKPTGH